MSEARVERAFSFLHPPSAIRHPGKAKRDSQPAVRSTPARCDVVTSTQEYSSLAVATGAPIPMNHPLKTLKPAVKMLGQHAASTGGWDSSRASRHERGYGSAWDRVRRAVMQRDCGLCQPSKRHGIVAIATAVDHIVPKHRGGTDDETNLQAISHMVHAAKTNAERNGQAWDEDEWFSQQGRGGQMSGAPGQ